MPDRKNPLLLNYIIVQADGIERLCRGKKDLEVKMLELHGKGITTKDYDVFVVYRGKQLRCVFVSAGDVPMMVAVGLPFDIELV